MKLSKESKIGITTVLAIAFLYWGIHYLRGINLLQPNNSYYASYTHVDGLAKSAPVMLDGFQVGVVEDIHYNFSQPGHIIVKMTLDKHLMLPRGTEAVLTPALIGSTGITLRPGNGTEYAAKGDTLASSFDSGLMESLRGSLLPQIEEAVCKLNVVLGQIENQLSDTGDLRHTLSKLSATSDHLHLLSANLNKMVKTDLPPIISNIGSVCEDLSGISDNLSQVDFAASMKKVDNCLLSAESILAKVNSPDNTLGLLLNDTAFYFNINNTVKDADRLLIDLKANPKRYVHFSLFGGKNDK